MRSPEDLSANFCFELPKHDAIYGLYPAYYSKGMVSVDLKTCLMVMIYCCFVDSQSASRLLCYCPGKDERELIKNFFEANMAGLKEEKRALPMGRHQQDRKSHSERKRRTQEEKESVSEDEIVLSLMPVPEPWTSVNLHCY